MNYDYLWESGPQMAQNSRFRLGTDSVLLGNFINLSGVKKGIDLGCNSGVIPLLLLSRSNNLHMTGIEIDAEAASLAVENMRINSLYERCTVINGDLRNYRELFKSGSFDMVAANPPYFQLGSGSLSPDSGRASARGELTCTIDDICAASEYLLRWDGKAFFVYRPDRLVELFSTMTSHGIEPKKLRAVSHTAESAPSLVLVEGRRGGKSGLKMEPVLIIKNPDGSDTEEILKIYHRK